MDNSRTMRVVSLKSTDNLNTLCQSYHEGVYSFKKDVSLLVNNYPEAGASGFLFISTDFDDKYCLQKITTMNQKFFYRTGVYTNGLFVWSEWDSYASITDIPNSITSRNESKFVTKEEFYPKRLETDSFIAPNLELSSILDEYYKFYGEYKGESLLELPNIINLLEGPYKDKNRRFFLGYMIKEEDNYNGELNRVPTGKSGLLQIFSSMFLSGHSSNIDYPVINTNYPEDISRSDVFTTFIFTEFDTGDIYITRTFNNDKKCFMIDRYGNTPNIYDDSNLTWTKYSYSKVRSYNLNVNALEFLKLRNRQFIGEQFTNINSIMGDYDNTRNEEYLKNKRNDLITSFNNNVSWNDDSNIALNNNPRGIPYFNNSVTDNDFSMITSLFPTGTSFKYPMIKNDFIQTEPFGRRGDDGGIIYTGRYIMPIWNSFNLNYNTLKLTKDRFSSEEIKKEDL